MNRSRSYLGVGALLLLLVAIQGFAQSQARDANENELSRPPASTAIVTPGNVEHGRYIAEHVAMCVECHSGRDSQGNIVAAQRYMGGAIPPSPPWTSDWAIRAPRNKGLPGYTDDQAMRLLTSGSAINREGRQLQLPMPRFRMSPQDAADVIAFLRSLR